MKHLRHVPMGLLVLFSIKALISIPEHTLMGIILGLSALIGFIYYKDYNTEIKEVQARMSSISSENEHLRKEVQEVKSYISAARITDGLRNPLKRI